MVALPEHGPDNRKNAEDYNNQYDQPLNELFHSCYTSAAAVRTTGVSAQLSRTRLPGRKAASIPCAFFFF